MNTLTVLIIGVGSTGAYAVIKGLKHNGERPVRILGTDVDPDIASRYLIDRFDLVPHRTSPDFMARIQEILEREHIDVIFPVPTLDLEGFSQAKASFEAHGRKVVVSDMPGLGIANNKARLYRHLEEAGFDCIPGYTLVKSFAEFREAIHERGYPDLPVCFRKPVSTGAQGFRILDGKADRLQLLLNRNPDSKVTTLESVADFLEEADPFPELIVQEYLPGDEYDVDVLACNGKTLVAMPRKNERMLAGISMVGQFEDHQQIIALTEKVVASLGLSYVVSPTFKLSASGKPKLIEINPRIPASIGAAWAAGVNMTYLAVKLALGEPVTIPPVHWGTRLIRYWGEFFLSPAGEPVELGEEQTLC